MQTHRTGRRSLFCTTHAARFCRVSALLIPLTALFLPATAGSAPNDQARLAIHLLPTTSKAACTRTAAAPACAATVTAGGLYPTAYFAYLLVQNADPVAGIAGLQCGIRYNGALNSGIDIFAWTLCATLEFSSGGWPASNSGNLITWDSSTRCQRNEPGGAGTGVVATAGYFYLAAYTADVLELIPRPVDGRAKVADCANQESLLEGGGVHHNPSFLGAAAFSAGAVTAGYNPCLTQPPGPLDCTISGPATIAVGSTGTIYSVDLAPIGASFQWTISGNASIVGSATARSVVVSGGPVGSADLEVLVTFGAEQATCSRNVTIVPGPPQTCSINGPDPVIEFSTGSGYTITASAPISSVSWSITGDGTIVGSTTGSSVTVTAGAPGAFDLTADVQLTLGRFTTCTRTITVSPTPPPSCGITGPSAVDQNSASLAYSVTATPAAESYQWTITGDGAITSSTTGPGVQVTSGAPGAFELQVDVMTAGGGSATCLKSVTVNATPAPTCSISGLDPVAEGATGLVYGVSTSVAAASYLWSVTGNALLTSPATGSTVQVTAGTAGAFELRLDFVTIGGRAASCTRTVTVVGAFSCAVTGPDAVVEGAQSVAYTVSSPGTLVGLAWSLTGNAAFASPPSGTTVFVTAGDPGAFEVTASAEIGGVPTTCSRSVTVNPISCVINGPASVPGLQSGIGYSSIGDLQGASYLWSVTGNASINGSATGHSVTLMSGTAGTFDLSLTLQRGATVLQCSRTITVTTGGAAGSQAQAKLMLHALPTTSKAPCERSAARPPCNLVNYQNLALYPTQHFVYLLVGDAKLEPGVAGLQCGINYNAMPHAGVDIVSWTLCATLEFPSTGWPNSGGGNLITWDATTQCQRTVPPGNDPLNGVVATAGYFYLAAYTPDLLRLTPRPVDGKASVADCFAGESLIGGTGFPPSAPSHLGIAAFGQSGGYNPCGFAFPVQKTSWSAIKAQYGDTKSQKGSRP